MEQRTLLIATTNAGKLREIKAKFATLPFKIIGFDDLETIPAEPEEYGKTIEENALIKAKYYGEATGSLTIADDSGLYITALDGWPGVKCARVADTAEERNAIVLQKLEGVDDRSAVFRACIALYDPIDSSTHLSMGQTALEIAHEPAESLHNSWGYNNILFVPAAGKTYAEMTIQEKNEQSHRSKALQKMKYHIHNTYKPKNIPVPFSLVVHESKILMLLRNDPTRPDFHKKWEFPGGGIEFEESIHKNVIRETKEESGLDIEVVKLLQHISVESVTLPHLRYQIILIPYVCRVTGGELSVADEEVLDAQWFAIDDILDEDLVGANKRVFIQLLPELKQFLETNPL